MKTVLQFILVRPALAAFHLINRHPVIAGLIVLFFILVAALWKTVGWANQAMAKIRRAVDYFGENAPLVRRALVWIVFLLVPGSFILWLLLKLAAWWSERDVLKITTEPLKPTTAAPNLG